MQDTSANLDIVRVQTSDEAAKCEGLQTSIKKTPSRSWSEKDAAIITSLPAKRPCVLVTNLSTPTMTLKASNVRTLRSGRVSKTPGKSKELELH